MERKRVIVIGGGLSGLTAANELLRTHPDIELTIL
jgi:protoporphyrinogen oxidase